MRIQNITASYNRQILDRLFPREELPNAPPDENELSIIQERTRKILRDFVTGKNDRIAFLGRVSAGRAGIVLSREDVRLRVSGHKIDPIRDDHEVAFVHFDASNTAEAIETLLEGTPILLQVEEGAIALRWDPFALEVFGRGEDSY